MDQPSRLRRLASSDIGLAGAVHVAGACFGALLFGQRPTDSVARSSS